MEKQTLKIIGFAAVSSVVGALFGYFFSGSLQSGNIIWPIVFGVLFLALLLLQSLFVKSGKILALAVLAESLSVAAFAVKEYSAWSALFVGAFFALLWISASRGKKSEAHSLGIDMGRFSRSVLPLAITALSLLITFVYMSGMVGKEFSVSKSSLASMLKPSEYILKGFIPGFSLDMRMSDFAIAAAGLSGIPKEIAVAGQAQLLAVIADAVGISVRGSDTFLDTAHRALSAQIVKIPENLRTPILLVFGFLVFLAVRGLGILLFYPTHFLTYALYKILLVAGFLRIETVDVKKEALAI